MGSIGKENPTKIAFDFQQTGFSSQECHCNAGYGSNEKPLKTWSFEVPVFALASYLFGL